MSAEDSIVVTGMGALGGGAASVPDLFAGAVAGRSPADWVKLKDIDPFAASRAPDPALPAHVRYARRLDRAAALGYEAARQAIEQAGLTDTDDRAAIGVILGSSRGPATRMATAGREFANGRVAPSAAAETGQLSLSGFVAQAFGLHGPLALVSATCASAATAICVGALHVAAGEADVMVVGGTEAPLTAELVAQFVASRVTGWDEDPARTCRPFDATRTGLMLGEGAGALVIERESSARARGAIPLARLSGWAYGGDNGGRTGISDDGEGLVRVAGRALARAGLEPSDIGYVNAHGTATRLNDPVEARALRRVFGGSVPPVSSTKPITGHCLGATPALEAVIATEALRSGCLPPTANHEELDPECPIDVIAGAPRSVGLKAVMSTSMGFWGVQAALIFEAS